VSEDRTARARIVRSFVAIGSNLDGPVIQVSRALRALAAIADTRLVARSRLYCNPAVGPVAQPDFVNAVAALDTALGARALLDALLAIEAGFGRERGAVRWGPRVIDLDLLVHGAECHDEADLIVPHPRLGERRFVLEPLAELAPDLQIPGVGVVRELLAQVPAAALRAVDERLVEAPMPAGPAPRT
jgi:2-amino-4-hydroxy-6-hydroxymethyldihydropteridine diphosphokinase